MPTLLLNKPPGGRLTDTTIIKILRQPEAWSALTEEQQRSTYSLLPALSDISTGEPMVVDTATHPIRSELYGSAIKDFIAYIEKQIEMGADKKAWQDEARLAGRKRMIGAYDESKEAEREEYWGQKAKTVHEMKQEEAQTASVEAQKQQSTALTQ